jgi:hypothetical protein
MNVDATDSPHHAIVTTMSGFALLRKRILYGALGHTEKFQRSFPAVGSVYAKQMINSPRVIREILARRTRVARRHRPLHPFEVRCEAGRRLLAQRKRRLTPSLGTSVIFMAENGE